MSRTPTTQRREQVLHLIRQERVRQIDLYGTNETRETWYGGSVPSYPWLSPYSMDSAEEVQRRFRHDYELYVHVEGEPTWMHLIREEVAEFLEATDRQHVINEGIQVAALIVSLIELELEKGASE